MIRNQKRLEHIKKTISDGLDPLKAPFIHQTAFINDCVELGKNHIIGPYVVIGWSSVGVEWDNDGKIIRFPQYGKVKIGENVIINAGAIIDRATDSYNLTEIGDRCIIGPMVHIGHNVKIGKDTAVLGNSAIAGSAIIGERCTIGFGSIIRNKIKIGDEAVVGLGAVVVKDVPPRTVVIGHPAQEMKRKNQNE